MTMMLTSSSFTNQQEIPTRHTGQGEDVSPALAWKDIPQGTKSLALIVDDPDAPDPKAPKMTFVHWVLYNLAPDAGGIAEAAQNNHLPPGTLSGINDFRRTSWGGPNPPIGRHRYFFKLYALDTVLPDLKVPKKSQLEKAMEGHVLAQSTLMGTYQRS